MTTDRFFAALYAAGMTPTEAYRTELRALLLVQRGYERRHRREDNRTLALVNTVRGLAGADPIDSLYEPPSRSAPRDEEAVQALKYRWKKRGWFDKDATA